MDNSDFSDDYVNFSEPIFIEVRHPDYSTEADLANWFENFDVSSDPRFDFLRWSTPNTTPVDQQPEMIITFRADGLVDVAAHRRFTRSVSFLNAASDSERMQQLIDLLINCWIKQGIIGVNIVDMYTIWKESERGVIAMLPVVTDLAEYCDNFFTKNSSLFLKSKVTSLQCVYREYEPSLDNFSNYGDSVEPLADEDGVVLIASIIANNPTDQCNAVIYFGLSDK